MTLVSNLLALPRNAIFMRDIKKGMSTLEETKDTHNYLDNTIVPAEVGTLTKITQSEESTDPEKIRDEMIKAGIQNFKTAV